MKKYFFEIPHVFSDFQRGTASCQRCWQTFCFAPQIMSILAQQYGNVFHCRRRWRLRSSLPQAGGGIRFHAEFKPKS